VRDYGIPPLVGGSFLFRRAGRFFNFHVVVSQSRAGSPFKPPSSWAIHQRRFLIRDIALQPGERERDAFLNTPPQSGRFCSWPDTVTNHVVGGMAVLGELDH
jgi:hypothetical protein